MDALYIHAIENFQTVFLQQILIARYFSQAATDLFHLKAEKWKTFVETFWLNK